MNKSDRAIVIFSKSPEPGRVKTRLRPFLTDDECLSLHLALLQDTIHKCGLVDTKTILYLTGQNVLPFKPDVPVRIQKGEDLGERMRNAFIEVLRDYEKAIMIGIDSPGFPLEVFNRAFSALDDHHLVLGPCQDGGYYLIGLQKIILEIFTDVPWGTPKVLEKTMERAQAYRTFLLPVSYDIDLPADLNRFENELQASEFPYLVNCKTWFSRLRDRSKI